MRNSSGNRRQNSTWSSDQALGQFIPPRFDVVSQLGQAESQPGQATVALTDPKLVAWAVDPNTMAQREAIELYQSIEVLRDDTRATAAYLKSIQSIVDKRRSELQRLRAQAESAARSGMGEVIDLEQTYGVLVDPDSMSGILDGARKAFKKIDKAVLKPVTQPIKDAGRAFDKAVIQPVAKPVDSALKAVDKAVIRPWSQPLNEGLKKVEKYTIRPAAKEAAKGVAVLDKYVPGWMTLLDFVAPLPLGTIIGGIVRAGKGGNLVSAVLSSALPGSSLLSSGPVKVADQVAKHAVELAEPVTAIVTSTGPGGGPGNFGWTISKGTHTFMKTKGSFMEKLQATTVEALSGFSLVVQLAAFVGSAGTLGPAIMAANAAAFAAMSASLTALQSGVSVLKAKQAADALKKQAKAAKRAADAELQRIAAEEAAFLAEIARTKAQIAELRRKRAELEAAKRRKASQASMNPIAKTAQSLGVSEMTLVAGGLALIGGVIVVTAVIRGDD